MRFGAAMLFLPAAIACGCASMDERVVVTPTSGVDRIRAEIAVHSLLTAEAARVIRQPRIRPANEPGSGPRVAKDEDLALQVRETESAFAKSMAARDLVAFESHIADEAIFFGQQKVLRGKAAVAAGWKPFFEGAAAPFSWEPERVEVLDSGTLALSSGPVRDPEGRRIGTFNSVWRREADGRWIIVFDKGCPPCDCPPKP